VLAILESIDREVIVSDELLTALDEIATRFGDRGDHYSSLTIRRGIAELERHRARIAALVAGLHASREQGDTTVSLDWLIVRLEESQQHPASGADGGASAKTPRKSQEPPKRIPFIGLPLGDGTMI
jgi:predicted transcriptional regulator